MTRVLRLVGILGVVGCGPYYGVRETTYTVTQTAALPAPSGPLASGPVLRRNGRSFEGGFAYDSNNQGAARRGEGGGAQQSFDTRGWAWAAFNPLGNLELGLGLEWTFGGLTPASPDTRAVDDYTFARMGFTARIPFLAGNGANLGLNLEVLPMAYTFGRSVDVLHRDTSFTDCSTQPPPMGSLVLFPLPECRESPTPTGRSSSGYTYGSDSLRLGLTGRVGLFGTVPLGRRFTLVGGMLVQVQPEVIGHQVTTTTCDTRSGSGGGSVCGDTPDFPETRLAAVGTPWASVGVDLGPVTLHAQGYFNLFGPASIIERSPFGLSFATRLNF